MRNFVSSDPDAGIQVAVTPSQSAYFAGEPFSVTITFTNTRSPEAGPSSYGHKRGAHSISSAPLAQPPTSPGTPRTPVAPVISRAKSQPDAPLRRGLVGSNPEDRSLSELTLEQRRRRLLVKSLSVSIAPPELEADFSQTLSAGHQRTLQEYGTLHRSPLVPQSIPRTDSLPLSQNHPHARKQSVIVDSLYTSTHPTSAFLPSMTPNSSTSSFSLALDPIAEGSIGLHSSHPNTPVLGSPSIEPASPSRFMLPAHLPLQHSVYGYPPSSASSSSSSLSRPARPSNLGLGHPPSNNTSNTNVNRVPYPRAPPHLHPPRSAFSASFPHSQINSELILYSYAQLSGSVAIVPVPGAPLTQDHMLNMKRVRESLLKKSVVGGGSMDINSSLLNRTPSGSAFPGSPPGMPSASAGGVVGRRMSMGGNGHGRASSLTGALLSMLSPSSLMGPSHSPTPEASPSPSGSAGPGRWRSSSASAVSTSTTPSSEAFQALPLTPTDSFPGSGQGVGLGLEISMDMGGRSKSSVVSPHSSTTNLGSAGVGITRSRRGSNSSNFSTATATSHSRRGSVAWMLGGGGESSTGAGITDSLSNLNAETPLPTFEVQPAMLAVDLSLAPGESRSYTYTVNLPDNLPPTFRGKALRFSYELVVGLCRAGQSNLGLTPNTDHAQAGSSNVSKLMKVPIRIYNNVVVEHAPQPYDLLWPVGRRKDLAMPSSQAQVVEKDIVPGGGGISATFAPGSATAGSLSATQQHSGGKGKAGGLEELIQYMKRLLESLPPPPTPIIPSISGTEDSLEPSTFPEALVPLPPELDSERVDLELGEEQSEVDLAFRGETTAGEATEVRNGSVQNTLPSTPSLAEPSSTSLLPPSPAPSPLEDSTRLSGAGSSREGLDGGTVAKGTCERENSDKVVPISEDSVASPPDIESVPEQASRTPSALPPPPLPLGGPVNPNLDRDMGDGNREGLLAGRCREAVEILTRTQKKASYDVTKDGVKVAVLTFPKSSYRLGETISGIVELNERKGRARVLQLAAFLEAHESLPSSLFPSTANKNLRRTYAEHFSSFLLNTLRTTFSLDIPSDASPAFRTCVGPPREGAAATSFGGVEWKVRLCLLVGVAREDADVGTEDVRFKSMVRDGPRGEWGSEWKALDVACPLEKEPPKPRVKKGGRPGSLFLGGGSGNASNDGSGTGTPPLATSGPRSSSAVSWSAFFASYLSPSSEREYHDGDELGDEEDEDIGSRKNSESGFGASFSSFGEGGEYDGIKPDFAGGVGQGVDFAGGEEGWSGVRLEMVECEVPVRVWPGNTAFKAVDVVFEV